MWQGLNKKKNITKIVCCEGDVLCRARLPDKKAGHSLVMDTNSSTVKTAFKRAYQKSSSKVRIIYIFMDEATR